MEKKEKEISLEKLLTKKNTADILSVSTETVDRLRRSGELESKLVRGQVRFQPSEVARYIDGI